MMYKFICPSCGNKWQSKDFHDNTCEVCNFWSTICTYSEGSAAINADEYAECLGNAEAKQRRDLQCGECGKDVRLYSGKHQRCECGGALEPVQDYTSKSLRIARLTALGTKSKHWQHVHQCDTCGKAHSQNDYDPEGVPCACGGRSYGTFSYDLNNTEHYFVGGREVPKALQVSNTLAETLKQYRERKKYSQRLMAAELGITQQAYSLIESGKRIPKVSLQRKIIALTSALRAI